MTACCGRLNCSDALPFCFELNISMRNNTNIIFRLALRVLVFVYLFNMLYKYDCQLSAKQMHFPISPTFPLSLALGAQNGAFYVSL